MKKRIMTVAVVLVSLLLFVGMAPRTLRNAGVAWFNWDSLMGRDGFYFKQRQWLADARTIAAGVRYLFESSHYGDPQTGNVAKQLPWPAKLGISTNSHDIAFAEPKVPRRNARQSKFDRVFDYAHVKSNAELSAAFALADAPSNGLSKPYLEARSNVPLAKTPRLPQRAFLPQPELPGTSSESTAASLMGT